MTSQKHPIRIVQFGEGNFLRAFVDWMVDQTNRGGFTDSGVAIVQPIPQGLCDALQAAGNHYHVLLRGIVDGKTEESLYPVASVSRSLNPYGDPEGYLSLARLPELELIVSNTTEAGIAYDPAATLEVFPAASFPGKLTQFLLERFRQFGGAVDKGLVILPCELIDHNGDKLREIVRRHAQEWALGDRFLDWLDTACVFLNSLVDRIVTGHPKGELSAIEAQYGIQDPFLVTAEPFLFWVIEGPVALAERFPFHKAGVQVIWTDDMTPYRDRKVRILNGAHTSLFAASFLSGVETVGESLADPDLRRFLQTTLFFEIMPTLDLPEAELTSFSASVLERFANPFIRHEWLSIALNAVSKWKTRVLPSLALYLERKGTLPACLSFSLAALLVFYRIECDVDGAATGQVDGKAYAVKEERVVLEAFAAAWATCDGSETAILELAKDLLGRSDFWGTDLALVPGLVTRVATDVADILRNGMRAAVQAILDGNPAPSRMMRVHSADPIAIALADVPAGAIFTPPSGEPVKALVDIRQGHKMALVSIPAGTRVLRYGASIGEAIRDIVPGEHVHSHNLRSAIGVNETYQWQPNPATATERQTGNATTSSGKAAGATFDGYRRKDGSVGIRNEIWIVPTVGCVNRVAEQLAKEANARFAGMTDGFFAWTHPYGCSQLGDDHETTQRLLAGLVRHPNAAAVLVLGLGCENNLISSFREVIGPVDADRVAFLEAQQVQDEQVEGMALLEQLALYAAAFRREQVPVSTLTIGLKCGGSDGLSGITANPLAGMVSDRIIALGGSALLTEVPEMFGAETILMNRCGKEADFHKLVALIDGFKDYYTSHGQPVNENPSPGNREGGITTLEEKSLGCIQKGGSSPVTAVLRYGEPVAEKGLNLLEGPGNDIVSLTALSASGAHLVLFTTGRGTPLGGPVPTVKISSNDALMEKKPHWIDFNAGRMLTEEPEAVADALLRQVLDTASGRTQTRNEEHGWREIAIFKNGVTL